LEFHAFSVAPKKKNKLILSTNKLEGLKLPAQKRVSAQKIITGKDGFVFMRQTLSPC